MATAITPERLRELLHYNPDTGVFTWRASRGHLAAGRIAGYGNGRGYIQIKVDDRAYVAHRLAWLYMHGRFPSAQLDHINGVRGDNRIANLREASQSENQQNIKGARRGSATRLGVSFAKGKWRAEIQVNGRRTNLGHYPTEDSAHAAYLSAKRVMHPFGRL